MYRTKNDLPEKMRATVAHLLNGRLADLIDLQLQSKQAHWNVKGASFIALHELFDQVASGVQEYVDLVAERIVQLGGVAEGTLQAVAGASQLNAYGLTAGDWSHHVERLSSAIAVAGEGVRESVDKVDDLGDADTADILTEISRGLDKWLWFVEAHLQHEGSRAVPRKGGRKG
ncbi:MAG TPA: DNA starvation/stationary phase protection protein Dps [Vicinamibacterales bacterium]|nr:DNA starvation/stationary phase protection protein Dps [Vicinamibacterales bacterium]